MTDPRHAGADAAVTRHEEELRLETAVEQSGVVGQRKVVEREQVADLVPREFESAAIKRSRVEGEDSGEIETLPDGSVSVPVFEEELVITKRRIVRERIVIRKSVTTEKVPVEAELLKERVEVGGDGLLEDTQTQS